MNEKLQGQFRGLNTDHTFVLIPTPYRGAKVLSSVFATAFVLFLGLGCFTLATASTPLDTKIEAVQSTTDKLKTDVPGLIARSNLLEQQLDHGTVLIGDYVSGHPGDTVLLPFLFVPSFFNATALEADVVIPDKLTISSVAPGAATTAAQKIVSTNTVNGVERFLVFGLNQNVIAQGEVIVMTLTIPSTTPVGQYPIIIDNPIASDADGDPILMSVMSGVVEVIQ